MALVRCHECGKEMSSEAKTCPSCGARNLERGSAASGCAKVVGIGVIGLLVLLVLAMILAPQTLPEELKAIRQARNAIELCHKERDDELKELAERRFIRSACEKMEADFRTKFGVDP